MRKFLFNTSVLSALFGVFGLAKTTKRGPRDWRLILLWLSWGATLAIAIGTVIEKSRDEERYGELEGY
jgi:steroid 5-alpha reductase family enzyme